MRDFTFKVYVKLLKALLKEGFFFQTFEIFVASPGAHKVVILRHDVDKLPLNSLRFAEIEAKMGIKATYYFRMVKGVYSEEVIKRISELGHEVGYHYETMDTCKGDVDKAFRLFCANLKKMRCIVPVSTICMHGSPLSKYDNRGIWKKYDYFKLGIVGEPYFDVDYNNIMYITDTGRKWNDKNISIRDKVESSFQVTFKSSFEIINSIESGQLPQRVMFNIHTQRWFDDLYRWLFEFITQKLKNRVKRYIVKMQ